MPAEDAHRDACWVLTIVGGLALTKALETALPTIDFSQWSDKDLVVLMRLFIFGAISIRLFIGSSVYFQQVHIEPGHNSKYPKCNYVLDFASSAVHFSLLYFMATNITDVPVATSKLTQERFFIALCAVMLYDWVWFFLSSAYSVAPAIRKWAIPNTFAFVVYVIAYVAFRYMIFDRNWFEIVLAILTLLFSIPDSIRMAEGRLPT